MAVEQRQIACEKNVPTVRGAFEACQQSSQRTLPRPSIRKYGHAQRFIPASRSKDGDRTKMSFQQIDGPKQEGLAIEL